LRKTCNFRAGLRHFIRYHIPINVQCGANVRTTTDYREAAKWVRRAAEQAIPRAQLDLDIFTNKAKECLSTISQPTLGTRLLLPVPKNGLRPSLRTLPPHDITANQQSRYCRGLLPKSHQAAGSEAPQPIGSSFVDSRFYFAKPLAPTPLS
jgi:hypothetical protein